MINLVNINQAASHLRLDIDDVTQAWIPDLQMKIQLASKATFDYYKVAVPEFTSPMETSPLYDYYAANPTAIPLKFHTLTLLILGELWEKRESSSADVISEALQRFGRMGRLPTMA